MNIKFNITDNNYEHAKKQWNVFKKHLKGYQNLSVESNTFLDEDKFKNFRETCIKTYDLDPAHFYSVPDLAWIAKLTITKVELELLTDMDMVLTVYNVNQGSRGGICYSVLCNAIANNKYMKNYYENKECSYLTYLDKNNLYGYPMRQRLATCEFKWVIN